jgi:hypothetical protein
MQYVTLAFDELGAGMKIAQIAPLMESVPPRLYGGTERVVLTCPTNSCGSDTE